MTAQANNLHTRAMLVKLTISSWTARKYDKKVSQEVADAHGASIEAGRYNKHLLPTTADITRQQLKAQGKRVNVDETPNSYKELMQYIGETRAWHYENTLPWSDEGHRVLTVANYQPYVDGIRARQHKIHSLRDVFVRDYPALKAEAERILNGMFKPEDYPDDVSERFDIDFNIDPVPTGGDWRVELSDEEIKVLAASTEARAREAFENAQADAVKRLHEVVAKIHERLSTKQHCENCDGKGKTQDTRKNPTLGKEIRCWICKGKGELDGETCKNCDGSKLTKDTRLFRHAGGKVPCWICGGSGKKDVAFRDTLIQNARDLCDVLKRINVADDPKLEEYRRQTELIATTTDPEALRDKEEVRAATAAKAQSILDSMNATYKGMFV